MKLLQQCFLVFCLCTLVALSGCGSDRYSAKDINEQSVLALNWMQTSAEYRALCYQAFNLAKLNIDARLAQGNYKKKLAIIVDCDETVIDNSAFNAGFVGTEASYSSKQWAKWMEAQKAKAIPGANEFLSYLKSKSVEVFYISNRKVAGHEATKANLKALGFPYVDDKHVLLRTETGDKQARRDIVLKEYEVVLYMGDNLGDFKTAFNGKSVEERFARVDELTSEFGSKFIVLPNPLYGEWEGAMYGYNWKLSSKEKDQVRKKLLSTWKLQ